MDNYERREKLKLDILEETEEKPHFHQDIELLYVLQGTLEVKIGEQTTVMKKEDILIINANQRHELHGSEDVMYAKLTILYELMGDVLLDRDVVLVCDTTKNDTSACDGLRRLIQKLISHYLTSHENTADFIYIALCYEIMDYLTNHFLLQKADSGESTESDKYKERVRQIDNYIRSNFRSSISIKDLAERMYLSDGYLSRFFKQNYGMSFVKYLTNVRLHHAVDELLYTDIPITRISYDNGFASVAIFNKAFKNEYGMTPSQMRKKAAGKKKMNGTGRLSAETEKKLENVLWKNVPEESAVPVGELEASLDATHQEAYEPYWSDMINIGSAADLMRSEIQEHVMILTRALHFHYIRFWSPFSKEMLIDINDTEHPYNFSRLDLVIDFLLGQGVKPFIELAEKPERLEGTSDTHLLYGEYEEADSLENWTAIMNAFVRHILTRYGKEEVDSWRFELWFDMHDLDRPDVVIRYMQQLKTARDLLHRNTKAIIGGAGIHGVVKPNSEAGDLVRHFFENMIRLEAIPDFVSLYVYAYDEVYSDGKWKSERSADPDFFVHFLEQFKEIRSPEFKDIPLYITEWNRTVSDRSVINDTCYQGAYIVKNYIDLFGKVRGMAYFQGTDRRSEYYDTNRLLFGGKGLLTRDGIMKPAAFAFDFLNRLYPYFIGKGSNFIATTNGLDHYGIVFHNCKRLSYQYYCVGEDKLDGNHLKKYFEDLDPLTVKIHLNHVRDGIYHVKIYRINALHGSVMRLWQEMNHETELSRGDIEYFRRVCEPNLSMDNIEVTNGQADVSVTMDANEIVFLRLRRRETI